MINPFFEFNPSKRVISPYIGSTVGSFENEVSHMCSNSFKRLETLCKKYGGCFHPVDNRKTSLNFHPSEDFSLLQSFDLISKSRPFCIFIIGDTYGPFCDEFSINDQNLDNDINEVTIVKRNLKTAISHGHSWLSEKPFCNASLLELEIEFAALQNGSRLSRSHCHFYFHDKYNIFLTEAERKDVKLSKNSIESSEGQEKLSKLKDRLIEEGYNVRFFHDEKSLDDAVLEDWSSIINLHFENEVDESFIGKIVILLF